MGHDSGTGLTVAAVDALIADQITDLGLGAAAFLAVGTGAGSVAAGNDSRITGAAQKAANLTDLASPSSARTALGLGTGATANLVGGLPAIPAPTLGVTIDTEARAAIVIILARLVSSGVTVAV